MTFRVGQKVVCVKRGGWSDTDGSEIVPVFGAIYTVRSIEVIGTGTFLLLQEIINIPQEYTDGFSECTFNAIRFRPIVERKTDISVFTKMLIRQGVEA